MNHKQCSRDQFAPKGRIIQTLVILCLISTLLPTNAKDLNLPKDYPEFSADDLVFHMLNGYFPVEVQRDERTAGNPITAILMESDTFFRPTPEQERKEEEAPLSETFQKVLPLIKDLRSLRMFKCDMALLKDVDLAHFKNHPSLEILDLSGCENITHKGLDLLTGLRLTGMELPRELRNDSGFAILLRNLDQPTKLKLRRWEITHESMKLISKVPGLTDLTLEQTGGITDEGLKHLAGLDSLENLSILNLQFGEPTRQISIGEISNVKSLKSLTIKNNSVKDAEVILLKNLTALEHLDIYSDQLTDAGLACLAGMPNLESLHLQSDRITGSGLSHFNSEKLKSVYFRCSNMTDDAPINLGKCKSLESIDTIGKFSAAGFAALIPLDLKELSASAYRLKDPNAVKNFILASRNSTVFSFMGGTPLTDDVMEAFAKVKEIREFSASKTHLTNRGLELLGIRKSMTKLDLTAAGITDAAIPTIVAQFPNIERLVLSKTAISTAALKQLQKLEKLNQLEIGGSRISRLAANEIGDKMGWRVVD